MRVSLVDQLQDKESFVYQLQNYKPNLFNFQPDFTSLSLALDVAEQPDLVPQSKDSILYITPLPLDQSLDQLPALQARAMDLRVPVNVWLVAPETASNAPAVAQLTQLASPPAEVYSFLVKCPTPNPEDYVGRLRNLYELVYTSDVNQSGMHSVAVEGNYGNQTFKRLTCSSASISTCPQLFWLTCQMKLSEVMSIPRMDACSNPASSR